MGTPIPVPAHNHLAANLVDTILVMPGGVPASLFAHPNGRLDSLLAQHSALKAQADAYATQLKELVDAIKVEAITAAPGHDELILRGSAASPLKLSHHNRTNFDRKRFIAEHPGIDTAPYESTTTVWTLRAVSG